MTNQNVPRQAGQHMYPASPHPLCDLTASKLGGTGRIADDLYLLGHNDRTGRPSLGARPLGIGLASALLAELMLGDSISLQRDGVIVAHRRWPADGLGRRVRDQVAAEGEARPVRDWLLFFARSATGGVAGRLEQAGYLRHVRSLIPGRPGRWVPVDADWAYAPVIRVRSALNPARPLDPHRAVLAGLAGACGLGFRIAQAQMPGDRSVEEATSQLAVELRHLITQAQAAVDSAVLSHRA